MDPGLPGRPLIGLLLRLAYQHYSNDIDAALREAGFDDIRPGAANVFPFVPPDGITVSRLAELARVRKQSMTQAVDQLERTGYVERRQNPRDRRSQLVFLTTRGAAVPPVTHAAAERVEQRWARLVGPAEFETLRASLLRLLGELLSHNDNAGLSAATSPRLGARGTRTLRVMAIGRFPSIVIDCPDPGALAAFYAALLDWTADASPGWADIRSDDGQCVSFQRVAGYIPPRWPGQEIPQQMHFDVIVEDLDAAEAAVLGIGATKPGHQPGTTFRVFLDPAGHPFCLCTE